MNATKITLIATIAVLALYIFVILNSDTRTSENENYNNMPQQNGKN